MGVVRPVHVAWVMLAVAIATVGFAAASCGSGNGQAGSALSSAIGSGGSGLTPPSTSTVTTTTPPVTTTTTSPGTTVLGLAPGTPSTEPTETDSGASGWVYALIGAVIVALIAGMIWLFRRGKSSPAVPVATPKSLPERQAILLAEVEQRLRSGWTVVSQTADTATLERSGQVTRVTVDEYGTLHEIPTPPGEVR